MVLKSYFDGGNQADSTQYDLLSLAAISGRNTEWKPFERDWERNLKRHCAPFLHTTDAVSNKRNYKNWTSVRINAFLTDCVRVALEHIARPSTPNGRGKFGLYPYIVTVCLKDFAQAKLLDGVSRNANEVCLRQALHASMLWGDDQAQCTQQSLCFDRGEPFYGFVCNILESRRARREALGLSRIISRTEADMRDVPALQLADLYAWSVNHHSQQNTRKWHKDLLDAKHGGEYLTKEVFENNVIDPTIWNSWGIAKRKDTK